MVDSSLGGYKVGLGVLLQNHTAGSPNRPMETRIFHSQYLNLIRIKGPLDRKVQCKYVFDKFGCRKPYCCGYASKRAYLLHKRPYWCIIACLCYVHISLVA